MCSIQFAAIKVTATNAQKSYFQADPWREIGIACASSPCNFKMMGKKTVPTVGKRSMCTHPAISGSKRHEEESPVEVRESQPGNIAPLYCISFPDLQLSGLGPSVAEGPVQTRAQGSFLGLVVI